MHKLCGVIVTVTSDCLPVHLIYQDQLLLSNKSSHGLQTTGKCRGTI